MERNVSWDQLKNYISTLSSPQLHYLEDNQKYEVFVINGNLSLMCLIFKDGNQDVIDFEDNYKDLANKSIVLDSRIESQPPFNAKVLPDGSKVFRRVRGIVATINNAQTNIDFIVPFQKCKITGLQIIGATLGDKAKFQVLDDSNGTVSGYPGIVLNTFGENVYVAPGEVSYPSKYDADLFGGLVLRIVYDSIDQVLDPPRKIYINFDLHEVVQ